MILAHTSAWIEYDRASGSAVHRRMRQLLGAHDCGDAQSGGGQPGDPEAIATTEPVIMEVLAGARSEADAHRLRRLMNTVELIAFRSTIDFESAALIFRRCRAQGITPRGLLDCSIAAVAWRSGAKMLSADRDLLQIANVMSIGVEGT